jgi:ferritin-like metal-binding protein YciE
MSFTSTMDAKSITEAAASATAPDIALLNSAIELEHAGIKAYHNLTEIGQLSDTKLAKLLASTLGVETTHVSTLAAVLKHGPAYVAFVK